MKPKLPASPPDDLRNREPDLADWPIGDPLWHIANTAGSYPTRFGQLRSFGPLPTGRFDPHPEPAAEHPGERILYAAGSLTTDLAERFQAGREIWGTQPDRPIAYSWFPTRPLRLIDLTGEGALRVGASHTLNSGPKRVTRSWARAIRNAWPDIDGLLYTSSMTGRLCVAIWAPAADSFPRHPQFARLLADPAQQWVEVLQNVAAEIHYDFFQLNRQSASAGRDDAATSVGTNGTNGTNDCASPN